MIYLGLLTLDSFIRRVDILFGLRADIVDILSGHMDIDTPASTGDFERSRCDSPADGLLGYLEMRGSLFYGHFRHLSGHYIHNYAVQGDWFQFLPHLRLPLIEILQSGA